MAWNGASITLQVSEGPDVDCVFTGSHGFGIRPVLAAYRGNEVMIQVLARTAGL